MNPEHAFFLAQPFLSFFFNDTANTEIYTLSLHDALPIYVPNSLRRRLTSTPPHKSSSRYSTQDRKSTRLNSSHSSISYAVFCLKKKKKNSLTIFFLKKKNQ